MMNELNALIAKLQTELAGAQVIGQQDGDPATVEFLVTLCDRWDGWKIKQMRLVLRHNAAKKTYYAGLIADGSPERDTQQQIGPIPYTGDPTYGAMTAVVTDVKSWFRDQAVEKSR